MKLSELIIACGEDADGVVFQNLDQCAMTLDWSVKKGTRITFGTDQTITPGEGTDKLGLVIWLDRQIAADTIARSKAEGHSQDGTADRQTEPREEPQ